MLWRCYRDAVRQYATTIPTRDPSGPFGAKAAAEIPADGVVPAVVNAIYDATGVRLRQIPVTPERVWCALRRQIG